MRVVNCYLKIVQSVNFLIVFNHQSLVDLRELQTRVKRVYNPSYSCSKQIMSPDRRLPKSVRQKIRTLKQETRQTQDIQDSDQTPWENMEKILRMRLPERKITDNSLIKAWFEIRMETKDKSPQARDEARTAFFKLHRDELAPLKDFLMIITQTVR